jgi:hypothetical protein
VVKRLTYWRSRSLPFRFGKITATFGSIPVPRFRGWRTRRESLGCALVFAYFDFVHTIFFHRLSGRQVLAARTDGRSDLQPKCNDKVQINGPLRRV